MPIWAILDREALAWPGEGDWLPVPGDAWLPLSDRDRGDAASKNDCGMQYNKSLMLLNVEIYFPVAGKQLF